MKIKPTGIPGSFIEWEEVHIPYIPLQITDPNINKQNKTMKTYKIPVLELHDTKIPEVLVNAVKNGLAEHLNPNELGYTPILSSDEEGTMYIGVIYKGHEENVPRKYSIKISVVE